ncbi:GPI ethanolamine phosphate transferase 1 [Hermetia illucens]|nr:GPI ethanolamine phosphate transferase 1 [Hermetia illucens]XP_037902931.1 GPI ethanolamine phosphate transferase 1 [Hermetia illucens]XP_037902932.1 GPI ethanolamine phosphate transferase 1 [Hermetia illucens]
MNWIVETTIVHVLFLGSIFVIYFRSPVIQGLHPQSDLLNPPAKRLVLFVTDGLRAESFFDEGCKHVPQIRDIFMEEGMVGVSHTRVPTESRPGHIALIAGLYEDPTAVTKGWQENPIDFDSVFNRSRKTYAWGSNDVLSAFSKADYNKKMEFYAYDHALDFSGKEKTYQLDMWVFSRARDYIVQNAARLKSESRIVFFFHLLGLDTAGHVHKPGSPLFFENLKVTDNGIFEMYQLFKEQFDDGETAFILTSDHGMTDKGSHGAGDIYETETPLVAWGAGIHNWHALPRKVSNRLKSKEIAGTRMASFDIEQADIAPLMAALIGTAMPINNYGKLPRDLLNVPDEYIAKAMFNNALQTLAQYEKLFAEFKEGLFSSGLPSFDKLNDSVVSEFKASARKSIQEGSYENVIEKSEEFIDFAIEGIEYYQMYYQHVLLFCTSLSFLGWIYYLLIMLENRAGKPSFRSSQVYTLAVAVAAVFEVFICLQGIPQSVGIYFILPVFCWARVFKKINMDSMRRTLMDNWKLLLGIAVGTELLVLTFFRREVISVAILGFIIFQNLTFKGLRFFDATRAQYYEWIFTGLLLLIFPLIPLRFFKKNDFFLMFGGLLWMTKLCLSVKDLKNSLLLQLLCLCGFINCVTCLYLQNSGGGLWVINILLTWALSGLAIISPIYSDITLKYRPTNIFFYFAVPFFHLSIGYEMTFFALLGVHVLSFVELSAATEDHSIPNSIRYRDDKKRGNLVENLNISAVMLLLIFLSFFGTGNMASVSSFDPMFVRFFVTTFSPFTMSALIILKLIVPILFITASITALTFRKQMDEKKMFLSLLLICELMGLNFLFMVTNKGSWLEIGTSISHFVIMEVTTLVLAVVSYVSKLLLFTDASKNFRVKTGKLV